MALIPYDNFPRLDNLRRELDRFISEFPRHMTQELMGPRIDVYETENEVVASCEIPGIEKREDINVYIDDDVLTISGTINRVQEVKEEQVHRRERYQGHFRRSIKLPAQVQEEGARASYKNGVLEVRMTKLQPEKRRGIDVEFH
ncbi:MAG: Hsp20/alpha crystallin family protein [Desulfotomaculum sp.]|nr:Hsp20/alpha crystallin family protein [Desulfotomaculum sp.]